MSEWYEASKETVLRQMQVSPDGLTSQAAKTMLAQAGENVLREQKRKKNRGRSSWNSFRTCW